MIILLDTHTLLWFLQASPQLSGVAKKTIEEPANKKLVSIATCWEIAIKAGNNKLTLNESSKSFLERELPKNNFVLLPISLEHVVFVETLPQHHRDPFDRILVAQALIEKIPIISSDNQLDAYSISRLW